MKRHAFAIACTSLLLAACATGPAGEPGLGRRLATVVQVGDAASFGPRQDNDCRAAAGSAAAGAQRYASVQYFSGRHAHLRIVPLADDAVVAAGDQVLVKTHSCSEALATR